MNKIILNLVLRCIWHIAFLKLKNLFNILFDPNFNHTCMRQVEAALSMGNVVVVGWIVRTMREGNKVYQGKTRRKYFGEQRVVYYTLLSRPSDVSET